MIMGMIFVSFSLFFAIFGFVTFIVFVFLIFNIPFIIIGFLMIGAPLFRCFSYKKTAYAFTDRRIIIKTGLWSHNFKIIDYDDVRNIQVNITIGDKLFNMETGTILIDSGELVYGKHNAYTKHSSFESIKQPYEVFKNLKEVSLDIQTDMEYPNKLRPDENPGYKTRLKK